jgi:hypothetical protein
MAKTKTQPIKRTNKEFSMTDICLFCIQKRKDNQGKKRWNSSLVIESHDYKKIKGEIHTKRFEMAVCKECRNNQKIKLKDVYHRLPHAMKVGKKELKPFEIKEKK